MKKLHLFFAVAAMTAALSFTAYAGEWKNDSQGWWYQNDDGTYPANKLEKVGDDWFYFSEAGYAQGGWVQLETGWYELSDGGICTNPIDPVTLLPVGAPHGGWVPYSDFFGSKEELGAELYNNVYWVKLYDVEQTDTYNASQLNLNQE